MHAAMQAPMLDLLDRLPRQNVRERAKGFGFEEFVVGEELYGTAEIRIGFPGQRGSCFYECISVQQVGSQLSGLNIPNFCASELWGSCFRVKYFFVNTQRLSDRFV